MTEVVMDIAYFKAKFNEHHTAASTIFKHACQARVWLAAFCYVVVCDFAGVATIFSWFSVMDDVRSFGDGFTFGHDVVGGSLINDSFFCPRLVIGWHDDAIGFVTCIHFIGFALVTGFAGDAIVVPYFDLSAEAI